MPLPVAGDLPSTCDPIVLLHGWGFDARAMAALAQQLQPLAEVVSVSLPGFDGAKPLPQWCSHTVLAALAEQLPPRCQLVGWSLGGVLAVQYAQRYPARVSRLVTLASNACFVASRHWPTAMPAATNRRFNTAFKQQPEATAKRFVSLVATGSPAERERLKQLRRLRPMTDTYQDNWCAALEYLAASDNRAALQQLTVPALHLLAEQDALVPAAAATALAALNPGHQVDVISRAGHALHLDQPQAVLCALTNFLALDSAPAGQLDKQQVARSFSRAASTYESVARLQRAVGEQLLAGIEQPAARVLDLGSGTGLWGRRLRQLTQAKHHWALDIAEGMLRYGRQHHPEPDAWLCADAEALPLAGESVDLIFSSLAIQWCENLPALCAELYRVLAPGGCLHIATLGPGTLSELQIAWQAVDTYQHVNRFVPVPSLVAQVQTAGFVAVGTGVQTTTLYSENLRELTRELKGLGARNVNQSRPRGLTGRRQLQRLTQAYEPYRKAQGLPASYEVVYLTARKPALTEGQ
jgi:malonyl-CoA O-methyltransferase